MKRRFENLENSKGARGNGAKKKKYSGNKINVRHGNKEMWLEGERR
jgi:hypothetical protein